MLVVAIGGWLFVPFSMLVLYMDQCWWQRWGGSTLVDDCTIVSRLIGCDFVGHLVGYVFMCDGWVISVVTMARADCGGWWLSFCGWLCGFVGLEEEEREMNSIKCDIKYKIWDVR